MNFCPNCGDQKKGNFCASCGFNFLMSNEEAKTIISTKSVPAETLESPFEVTNKSTINKLSPLGESNIQLKDKANNIKDVPAFITNKFQHKQFTHADIPLNGDIASKLVANCSAECVLLNR